MVPLYCGLAFNFLAKGWVRFAWRLTDHDCSDGFGIFPLPKVPLSCTEVSFKKVRRKHSSGQVVKPRPEFEIRPLPSNVSDYAPFPPPTAKSLSAKGAVRQEGSRQVVREASTLLLGKVIGKTQRPKPL